MSTRRSIFYDQFELKQPSTPSKFLRKRTANRKIRYRDLKEFGDQKLIEGEEEEVRETHFTDEEMKGMEALGDQTPLEALDEKGERFASRTQRRRRIKRSRK